MPLCNQAVFLHLPTKQMIDPQPQYQYHHFTDESKIELLHIRLNIQIYVPGLWTPQRRALRDWHVRCSWARHCATLILSKPCSDQTQVGTQASSEKRRKIPMFFHVGHLYFNRDIKITVGTNDLLSNLLEQIP